MLSEMECKKKSAKKRVKALCAKIKEQIEFYFSNSNLHKDRFFKKQIDKSKDGYIELSMLLSFNRLKALTEDVSMICKALSTSSMLQLSEDKDSVCRITPYSEPKDVDERTVYVEPLPTNVDHDWLKRVFSYCGVVTYVSLPRYKSTGDPKSFAFVEFETIDGAKKACKELNQPRIETVNKPGKFPKNNKALIQLKKRVNPEASLDLTEIKQECDLTGSENNKTKTAKQKRKRNGSTDGKDISRPNKQRKLDQLCGESSEETSIKSEVQNESVVESTKSEDEERSSSSGKKKKKKRRHRSDSFSKLQDDDMVDKSKYRRRSDSCPKLNDGEQVEGVPGEQVEEVAQKLNSDLKSVDGELPEPSTPCKARLALDSRSDNLSADEEANSIGKDAKRAKRKRKKESLDSIASSTASSDFENMPKCLKLEGGDNPVTDANLEQKTSIVFTKKRRNKNRKRPKPLPHLRVISKKEWLEYKNEYLATQRSNMSLLKKMLINKNKDKDNKAVQNLSKVNYEFVPNVIINVKSNILLNVKDLKEKLNPIADIAYIDLKEVDTQAYIRCRDKDSAQRIRDSQFTNYSFSLLQGDEEKTYWDKLRADREAKLNSKHRLKKRGTHKLIDKIEKINNQNTKIYFDD